MERVHVPAELLSFVEQHMASFQCGAHHMDHVLRVCSLAQHLAVLEGGNQKVAVVAALCHDILDSKLISPHATQSTEELLVSALRQDSAFLSEEEASLVLFISKNIGYRKLLDKNWFESIDSQPVELRCVQDADSLDAIGAVGIARCFAFGGKRNRPLFDMRGVIGTDPLSVAAYVQAGAAGSGLEHFFEKLLRLRRMMVTKSGETLAAKRQRHMLSWLRALQEELEEGERFAPPPLSGDAASNEHTLSQILRTNIPLFSDDEG